MLPGEQQWNRGEISSAVQINTADTVLFCSGWHWFLNSLRLNEVFRSSLKVFWLMETCDHSWRTGPDPWRQWYFREPSFCQRRIWVVQSVASVCAAVRHSAFTLTEAAMLLCCVCGTGSWQVVSTDPRTAGRISWRLSERREDAALLADVLVHRLFE